MIGQKCRIIFSQHNDLIAYSCARNVSEQRGEVLGESVGCQVYANNRYFTNNFEHHINICKSFIFIRFINSSNSILTFCTNEILLKNLMNLNDASIFNSITHIILVRIWSKILHIKIGYLMLNLRMIYKIETDIAISF